MQDFRGTDSLQGDARQTAPTAGATRRVAAPRAWQRPPPGRAGARRRTHMSHDSRTAVAVAVALAGCQTQGRWRSRRDGRSYSLESEYDCSVQGPGP